MYFFDTKIAQKIRENVGGDFCLIPFGENDFFFKRRNVSRAGSITKILINLNVSGQIRYDTMS